MFTVEFQIIKAPPLGYAPPENKSVSSVLDLFDTIALDSIGDPIAHYVDDGSYTYIRPQKRVLNVTVSHCGTLVDAAYKTWVVDVDVTLHNNGTAPTNYTVSVYYYNATFTQQIGTPQTITNLAPDSNVTLTFSWDISALPVGVTYTVKTNVTSSSGASREFVNGQMTRRRWGDVTGDGFVKLDDVGKLDLIYSLIIKPPYWPLMPDITGDCYVRLDDVGKMDLIYSGILTEGDP
jgi:hypothetical protein